MEKRRAPYMALGIAVLTLFCQIALATNLQISNVRALNRGDAGPAGLFINVDIRWENSWNNDKNHDAAWIFVKYAGYWDNHARVQLNGHKVLQNRVGDANPTIEVVPDQTGLFIKPAAGYRGAVDVKLQIALDTAGKRPRWNQIRGLNVFGIEMVHIPEGGFTLGSPDSAAIKRAAFYRSGADGQPDGLFAINSEDAINVGPEAGQLYYWSETALYNGDQSGPIPADFPKGYDAFYIMKYELTQGQYVNFLNTIPDGWTFIRTPHGGRGYYQKRGCIRLVDGRYVADNSNRPMNFVSFTDGLAFTDWAALRPITEFEYTKAARGPSPPIPGEFVWGTDNYDVLERYVDTESELVLGNDLDESDLTDEHRARFGASYYWVMDLSGSVWEKVITVGNPVGREFVGTHGDGTLDFGHATNQDWPKSDDEVGGFGYRGGGYYEPGTSYSDFNPHSPIGYRYYGAWSGGPRSIAYGYRAGRSAQ